MSLMQRAHGGYNADLFTGLLPFGHAGAQFGQSADDLGRHVLAAFFFGASSPKMCSGPGKLRAFTSAA